MISRPPCDARLAVDIILHISLPVVSISATLLLTIILCACFIHDVPLILCIKKICCELELLGFLQVGECYFARLGLKERALSCQYSHAMRPYLGR
jgi:hypothetical protein